MALLTVTNLTKTFSNKPVVDDLSFQFQPGACIALIGPNGAGKTTILRMLAQLLKPTAGKITYKQAKANEDIRSYIGYLPQYPSFYAWMTGMEFLVYSGELTYLSKTEATIRAEHLLDTVGLNDAKNKRIATYSGGMKQRLGIAQAIIHQPKLLLMDEPVSSLDPIGRREVLTLMEQLKDDMTILFSTHILTDADEISDELLLLHEGKIVESGSMNELRQKYQTAMIELRFEQQADFFQAKVNELPAVITSTMKRDVLYVSVKKMEAARKQILAATLQDNWPLDSFSINRASLEDMFMKVVD